MDMSNKEDCGCFPAVPYSAVCYTMTCTILNLLQVCMGNSPYRICWQHTSVSTFPRRLCKTDSQNILVILHQLQAFTVCFLQTLGSHLLL